MKGAALPEKVEQRCAAVGVWVCRGRAWAWLSVGVGALR